MGVSFALAFLFVAVAASLALGTGTAWLVVRKTKRPALWVLAPVFAVLWLMVGALPVALLGYRSMAVPRPVPPPMPTAPIQVAPAEDVAPVEEMP